ncbi:type II toxin-antitoxin system HigB family toxin [Pseudomonas sp. MH10]|nr:MULTISPECIES: type II toxin-antitoxin system HigB family toxin [unclassified Pseudomonas]MEB0040793.1 type II toxin-antitoxin system HigB family toxin [Pseudomonas sp. MH10]MEB0122962.1 type II toxin-antitoxin system HigB family toxin [Pseudomonas sp. CCI1.2]WPX65050.1 type II toxin-antitoxin system HigB family toxin [Pseudomonas sp. MH10]
MESPKTGGCCKTRVIAKRKLVKFREVPGHDDAEASLESWHDTALRAIWKTPQDVKDQIGNASVCGNNPVVFNIGGNKYGWLSRCSIERALSG